MILSCQNICKSFGEKIILKDASFHIEDREKAALIGNNGAGKTTLLRIIMEEISADSGQVVIAKDKKIGYLAQYQDIHGHHTIYEELIFSWDIFVRMKLVVPFTIPMTSLMWLPARHCFKGRIIGIPPATAASKRKSTWEALAVSISSFPWTVFFNEIL